jgi:hypothetical protein
VYEGHVVNVCYISKRISKHVLVFHEHPDILEVRTQRLSTSPHLLCDCCPVLFLETHELGHFLAQYRGEQFEGLIVVR